MVARPGKTRRFDTLALGVRAARPQPTADRQLLQQRDRSRQGVEATLCGMALPKSGIARINAWCRGDVGG